MLYKKLFFAVFVIFLLGCQPQAETPYDGPIIGISGGDPIIKEIEKEFDDNLDAALEELEAIENLTSS